MVCLTGSTFRWWRCSTRASPRTARATQAVTSPGRHVRGQIRQRPAAGRLVPARQTSPIFNYPYARTREALHRLAKAGPPDARHGYKLRHVNPANGGAPIATMGTFMQLLPKGFASAPYRCTDGTVFSVVEGQGESRIGDKTFRWKKRDHFVVPSWAPVVHAATDEGCCSPSPTGRSRSD